MSIIGTIIIGFIVGLLARLLHPGKDGLGIIMTTLLGVAGAMLATYGGQFFGLYRPGEPAGFIGAVVGAIIILFIVRRLRK
ncbi:GlsB/YeaQ/YmgE family stress response membrane protein [Aromatoleum anaerobium]|uniref:GlsB/YeaQ/YmgE family stress response membrane protein n=1 Tax=Aromatoleum anaerobium TaxID=182180 RepID=A0ABX1PKA8_9RHOO|nr:GlsB/YeaQ/YmgE family stress response membrane protein [Aromatoleum anaerobium]MCK0506402.1 GlsB/YeaQ/YmgE family stress response membrane protein [Aromatoleum anaerobium]